MKFKHNSTRNIYKDATIIYGKRRGKNLGDHLVKSTVKPIGNDQDSSKYTSLLAKTQNADIVQDSTKVEAFTATTRTKNLDAAAILNVKVNNLTSVANNIANMSSRPKEDNGHIPSPLLQNYF